MNAANIQIRDVRESDLPTLETIEEARWGRETGTVAYSRNDLKNLFALRSPFFVVAEKDDRVVGFYFGMPMSFSMADTDTFVSTVRQAHISIPHQLFDQSGESVYGVTVATIVPSAGIMLREEIYRRLQESQTHYFLGFSRLAHLDRYIRNIEDHNNGRLPYPEPEIALWYAHESMELLRAKYWDMCTPKPNCDLPSLHRPDTILRYHVKRTTAGLLRVVADYMPDRKSRNYGALLASKFPHAT